MTVATPIEMLPKDAKKIKRLTGRLNFLEKTNVAKMKAQPTREKTEVTRSIRRRVYACSPVSPGLAIFVRAHG